MALTDEMVASEQRHMALETDLKTAKKVAKEEKAKANKLKKKVATMTEALRGGDDYQESQIAELQERIIAMTAEVEAAQREAASHDEAAADVKKALLEETARVAQLTAELEAASASRSGSSSSDGSAARVTELEEELKQKSARIASLNADLESMRGHAEQLQDTVDEMKQQRGEMALKANGLVGADANYNLKEHNRRLAKEREELNERVQQLEAEIEALNAKLEAARTGATEEKRSAAEAAPADASPVAAVSPAGRKAASGKRRPLADNNGDLGARSPPAKMNKPLSLTSELNTPSNKILARHRAAIQGKQEADESAMAAAGAADAAAGAQQSSAAVGSDDQPNECPTQ